ncbi:DUF1330 domain-containing protein [Cognatishimia maritima]|uniref:Uncharacterized protein n=1 Tax=Cognatishimia maritima TaxID=870908 RepID=A0A1M5W0A9_9RHOB|nr:DUF1330 domain-containing protein [Cognatishimia maritima]SHH80907.1 protein of unknown function [Cognatishimia maritima]
MLKKIVHILAAAAMTTVTAGTFASAQDEKVYLIDFVVMNDGFDLKERNAYEAEIAPIAGDYGMAVIHSYNLTAHLSGTMSDAVRLNVWELPSPSAMQAVINDPRYAAGVPRRDEIHDMESLTLYMASSDETGQQVADKPVLIDLVVLNEGQEAAARDAYEMKVASIAAKYGFEQVASFPVIQKIAGVGPEQPMRLNLWSLQDPAGMQKLGADPEYVALENERNAIHDFSQLTLFFGQARSE